MDLGLEHPCRGPVLCAGAVYSMDSCSVVAVAVASDPHEPASKLALKDYSIAFTIRCIEVSHGSPLELPIKEATSGLADPDLRFTLAGQFLGWLRVESGTLWKPTDSQSFQFGAVHLQQDPENSSLNRAVVLPAAYEKRKHFIDKHLSVLSSLFLHRDETAQENICMKAKVTTFLTALWSIFDHS